MQFWWQRKCGKRETGMVSCVKKKKKRSKVGSCWNEQQYTLVLNFGWNCNKIIDNSGVIQSGGQTPLAINHEWGNSQQKCKYCVNFHQLQCQLRKENNKKQSAHKINHANFFFQGYKENNWKISLPYMRRKWDLTYREYFTNWILSSCSTDDKFIITNIILYHLNKVLAFPFFFSFH